MKLEAEYTYDALADFRHRFAQEAGMCLTNEEARRVLAWADRNDRSAELKDVEKNRWHYPSEGDLPETEKDEKILLFVEETDTQIPMTHRRPVVGMYKEGAKLFVSTERGYSCEFLPEQVIAWQYILLPGVKKR